MHVWVFCTDILEFTTFFLFFFKTRIYNSIKIEPEYPIPEADASYSSNSASNVAHVNNRQFNLKIINIIEKSNWKIQM